MCRKFTNVGSYCGNEHCSFLFPVLSIEIIKSSAGLLKFEYLSVIFVHIKQLSIALLKVTRYLSFTLLKDKMLAIPSE